MKSNIKEILGYKDQDRHFYIVLISGALLGTLYRYLLISDNILQYFPAMAVSVGGRIMSYKLQFVGFFLLMFVLPMSHILFWWRKPLVEIGFGFGDKKAGIKFTSLFILLLVIPFAYGGSFDRVVRLEYPMAKELITHRQYLPGYDFFYVGFYYIAWEFYFRGYLLFGLFKRYGAMEAVLIQTISSCLIHIDKPFVEILGSIPVGILLGYIALRTRSFWYVFLIHASLGVLTDFFIIYFQH